MTIESQEKEIPNGAKIVVAATAGAALVGTAFVVKAIYDMSDPDRFKKDEAGKREVSLYGPVSDYGSMEDMSIPANIAALALTSAFIVGAKVVDIANDALKAGKRILDEASQRFTAYKDWAEQDKLIAQDW